MTKDQCSTNEKLLEREYTAFFVLGGIPYYPHYAKHDIYVSPGYGKTNDYEFTSRDLVLSGAARASDFLWARPNQKPAFLGEWNGKSAGIKK